MTRIRLLSAIGWMLGSLLVPAPAAPVGEQVAEGVTRFHASPEARRRMEPSFALARPLAGGSPIEAASAEAPRFAQEEGRSVAEVFCDPAVDFYGTGMMHGGLRRNGHVTVAWNQDVLHYRMPNPAWKEGGGTDIPRTVPANRMYQCHPWVLAVRPDGSSFGILADTTWRTTIDLSRNGRIRFVSDGPPFPLYRLEGADARVVVRRLALLTGSAPLPPKWALGYQQCRYSYHPDSRVRDVVREFRQRKIPCDVIWLDIHHQSGHRIFTFDPQRFPDPSGLNAFIHGQDMRAVWMVNTGFIADTTGAPAHYADAVREGTRAGHWVRTREGADFLGEVWGGKRLFPDYLRESTRAWFAGLYRDFLATGVDGVWNDMNEPTIFGGGPEMTMPADNHHRADPALGGEGPHARYHNVYGMMFSRTTREGFLRARPDRRPFVLTRSSFIGGQRYAATWTGDNGSTQEYLDMAVPMSLNLALSGQPFNGPDIGGYSFSCDPATSARWWAVCSLFPFARGHAEDGTPDKEPWAHGADAEATIRSTIERRYRLMPYLYVLFHRHASDGEPIMMPAFMADPADASLRREERAFLLGPDLWVGTFPRDPREKHPQPALRPPPGWPPLSFGPEPDPYHVLPKLHLRPGAILPAGPVLQHVGEHPGAPLELWAAPDASGRASGEWIDDAGDGFAYQKDGFIRLRFTAEQKDGRLRVRVESREGRWKTPRNGFRVHWVDGSRPPVSSPVVGWEETAVVETGPDR